MIQTILVPLDGSTFSEHALSMSCELAKALHARLVLVCVAGSGSMAEKVLTAEDQRAIDERYAGVREEDHLLSTDPRMVEHAQRQVREIAEAELYITNIAARLAKDGLQVETAIPYGSAAEGILTEIDLHSADLVIIATNNRSGLNRLITGSVAQAVLARSPVPVLMVPPER